MSIFNKALFHGPKFSYFDMTHGNKVSMKFGDLVPVYWDFMMPNDRAEFDAAQVTRLAPMLAPVMDQMEVRLDAFALRLRSLGMQTRNFQYEDFFNPKLNINGSYTIPTWQVPILGTLCNFKSGTLYDYLGYPTLEIIKKKLLVNSVNSNLSSSSYVISSATSIPSGPAYYLFFNNSISLYLDSSDYNNVLTALGPSTVTWDTTAFSFTNVIINPYQFAIIKYDLFGFGRTPSNATVATNQTITVSNHLVSYVSKNVVDVLYELYKIDWNSLLDEYYDWVLSLCFKYAYIDSALTKTFSGEYVAPLFRGADGAMLETPEYVVNTYWKIVTDWYLNTGIFDSDSFYSSHALDQSGGVSPTLVDWYTPFKRNWRNDYFTSCLATAQAGNANTIPANSTIPDLRNLNSLQKFKELLLYTGNKLRDVVYGVFGIKMSTAVADMSEVLGSWTLDVNTDSVLQNSASQNGQPLASYAGTGLGYGGKGSFIHYVAEEPTIIMFLASVRPKEQAYYQGLPKKLTRTGLFDYAWPAFANVGEEEVYTSEIYLDFDRDYQQNNGIFGYNRRYASFMYAPDEVHGDFKNTLDYWHLGRRFDSQPSLSQEFLQVDGSADNLNRVFAVESDVNDKFYCHFKFYGGIVRSLPKHISYDL